MGTAGYLAPEQAAGQPVDRRADIFSLGCILYEMAAGERPFAGRSVAETIARVLHDEPRPLAEIKPNTPLEFQRIVGKCLAKDPARRYQHADDLALDLHDLAARPASAPAPRSGGSARTTTAARWLWPLATTALAGLAVWGWLHPRPEAQPQPASRLAVVVPNYGGASTAIQRQIAITPDGSTLLFPAIAGDGVNRTMRLALDEADPSPLPGVVPFLGDYIISADGREFLGNAQSRRMFRYSIAGGNPRPLPEDLQTTPHAVWSEDGSIWFRSLNEDAGLLHLAVDGTVSKRFGREHFGLAPMCILPGGRTAVVVRTPFGATTGPASVASGADLAWVRGAGKGPIEPLLGSRFNEEFPSVSADGRWLAFVSDQSGQNQVYVRSLTGTSDQVQVSVNGGTEPGWSRSGRELSTAPVRVWARNSLSPAWT